MLSARMLALACAGALVLSGAASAASPAVMLARSLGNSMQAFYNKAEPGLEIVSMTCDLATNERSAHCVAHYTVVKRHLLGIFLLAETIDPSTGVVHTKTVSSTCTSSLTRKLTRC